MKTKLNRYFIYLPFVAALLILLFQYAHGFPQGDDFTFFVKGGSPERIGAFYRLYYSVAGSRMANMLAQIFLLWDLAVWKVVTPFIILSISLLLFYYVKGRFAPAALTDSATVWNDFGLAAVCAVFPGFMPIANNLYGDSFLWLDGSCNYLYPLFFMLIGCIPIYNAIRERHTPTIFVYVSPICFLIAGLLHEQMAMLLFAMCVVAFIYLLKSKQLSKYIVCLCLISLVILIFTFTCPGAYRRFNMTTSADESGGIIHIVLRNIPTYLNAIFSSVTYWFWVALLGVCSLYMLRGKVGKIKKILSVYLGGSIVLSGVSVMLHLPLLVIEGHGSGPPLAVQIIAVCFWVLYLFACFIAMLLAARENGQYRYIVMLFWGMWASQGIPMLLASFGRPLMPLIFMIFLIAVSLFDSDRDPAFSTLKLVAAAAGLCLLITSARISVTNYNAYQNVVRQVNDVKQGKSNTVIIDYSHFNSRYFYFNAFNKAYTYDIKQYFGLPKDTRLKIIN